MKRLRTLFDAKLWKFLLVGVVNTLAGMGIMFGLYNVAGCSYWVSSAANYVLTSILSFFLNKHFTFQSRERGAGQVVRFAANIAVCYLIAYGIAKPLCLRLLSGAAVSTRDNAAMLVGMVLFTLAGVSSLSFEKITKAMMPLLFINIVALLIVTYCPPLVTWLPGVLMPM